MKINLKVSYFIGVLIFASITCYSQTIIDYETWTTSNGCNIFSDLNNNTTSINVPATINGVSSTIAHKTIIGQPTYDNSIKTVNLRSQIINGSQFQGTEYRLNVNFKQGFSYKITITAARTRSQQSGGDVLLRTDLTNGPTGLTNFCNGPENIDPNGSGNLKMSKSVYNGNFINAANANYEFEYFNLAANQTFLLIAAVVPLASGDQTIHIRKIKIEETPPPANFTLTPSSVTLSKGTSTTQIFTVNNVNNTPNVSGHTFNIGATPNGWLYNGSPAPSTITTNGTTNSISLSSVSCASAISNISASAQIGATSFPTNVCTVTLTNPTYSISPQNVVCQNSSTNIFVNAPLGSSVSWVLTNAPAGVTINPTGNPAVLTVDPGVQSRIIAVTATVITPCGDNVTTAPIEIYIGTPGFGASYKNGRVDGNPVQIYDGNNPEGSANPVCLGYGAFDTYIDAQPYGTNSVVWSVPSGFANPAFSLVQQTGNRAYFTWNYGGTVPNGFLQATVSNGCGSFSQIFSFKQVNCNPTGGGDPCATPLRENYYTISPNPADGQIKVSTSGKPAPVICDQFKAINSKNGVIFSEVIIYNKLGTVVKRARSTNTKQLNIPIADLISGVYVVEIIQQDYKERQQIIIK